MQPHLPEQAEILLLHILQVCLRQQKRLLPHCHQKGGIWAEAFPALGRNVDGLSVLL